MSEIKQSRRKMLKMLGASAGASLLPFAGHASNTVNKERNFVYCLNMSTIMGQNLGFIRELEIASKAGFRSVEIWMNTLEKYLSEGGSLSEAKKRIDDLGLKVENAIGFAEWIVDDPQVRKKGLEQLKKEMGMLAKLGCYRTAAPPAGATKEPGLDLKRAAERYQGILEIGKNEGVIPHLELWGFSKNLSRLGEVLYVASESGHPDAHVLLDIYHLYKGGSGFNTLHLVGKSGVEIFHVNDYPSNLAPEAITDADRIYTGEGAAPIAKILQTLRKHDKPLILSFEVFNPAYYAQDALEVSKKALAKMKAVAETI